MNPDETNEKSSKKDKKANDLAIQPVEQHSISQQQTKHSVRNKEAEKHPTGAFAKIADEFDPRIKAVLSKYANDQLHCDFEIEGPLIDYAFEQIHKGVVREVVWRIISKEYYPIEVAIQFKRSFFGIKPARFNLRGTHSGQLWIKPEPDILYKTLQDTKPFPYFGKS